MGQRISLFMWGYQSHFRSQMEYKAKRVLEDLAPGLEPEALLIGVRAPDATEAQARHPSVCLEPERGVWDPAIFASCAQRAEEIFTDHPDHQVFYGDAARMNDKPENIRRRSVHAAVREVLDAYDASHGTKTFSIGHVRYEGYHIVLALQFNKTQLDEYPKIIKPVEFREYKFSGGFLDHVIDQLLSEARKALWGPEPGRYFDTLNDDSEAILRRAGDEFCAVLILAARDVMFRGVFTHLNTISALRYEGEPGGGALVVAAANHPAVKMRLEFSRPVPLNKPKWARKALEMSRSDLSCVCTGAAGISGLGTIVNDAAEGVFVVEFTGHYKWQIRYHGTVLLQSSYGVPKLPRTAMKEGTFKSTFRRLFPGVTTVDEDQLWSIVTAATKQRHGTMIIVSERAEEEVMRLKRQGTPVTPVQLSAELVGRVSGIDGAIVVNEHGVCHAIGVILDGTATDEGDPARGARYNSAVRYVCAREDVATLAVVVSEDGDVNMIPELLPQVSRSLIEHHIARLKMGTIDDYGKPLTWLREHAFYLDAEQCMTVNYEIARIEATPREDRELRIDTPPFVPHPEMDPSYLLP